MGRSSGDGRGRAGDVSYRDRGTGIANRYDWNIPAGRGPWQGRMSSEGNRANLRSLRRSRARRRRGSARSPAEQLGFEGEAQVQDPRIAGAERLGIGQLASGRNRPVGFADQNARLPEDGLKAFLRWFRFWRWHGDGRADRDSHESAGRCDPAVELVDLR